MAENYTIVCDDVLMQNVINQIRAIKTFPAVIRMYDRVFSIATFNEAWALATGFEIGYFMAEDKSEKENSGQTKTF